MLRGLGEVFEEAGKNDSAEDNQKGHDHPNDELASPEEVEKLCEIVCWFADSTEYCDQRGASASKDGTNKRVTSEGFVKEEGSKSRIEDESRLENHQHGRYANKSLGEHTAWRVDRTGNGNVVI